MLRFQTKERRVEFMDLLAILGASAWTPFLFEKIKQGMTKPKVRIITHRNVEIGFTTYGPIFNIRLAFAVEHKDIVVSDLKIKIKHESGDERVFEWQGITQQVGKMTMPDAGVMPFEKEHSVLAIKLNQKDIEERSIRCQETSFILSKQEHELNALKKLTYLKAEEKYDVDSFLREPEMTDLYSFNKHAFPWKQGKYTVTIEIQSPEKFIITDNIRDFVLTPLDVEELEKNKDFLELDYKRILTGINAEDKQIKWFWRNPELIKT